MNATISTLKAMFWSFVFGYALIRFQFLVGSTYVSDFLEKNLLMLLITLLAINSATLGIVLSKLQEILLDNPEASFERTKFQMKLSVVEQLVLIVLGLLLLTFNSSAYAKNVVPDVQMFIDVSIAAIFCFSLRNLYDSANSVFVLLKK